MHPVVTMNPSEHQGEMVAGGSEGGQTGGGRDPRPRSPILPFFVGEVVLFTEHRAGGVVHLERSLSLPPKRRDTLFDVRELAFDLLVDFTELLPRHGESPLEDFRFFAREGHYVFGCFGQR